MTDHADRPTDDSRLQEKRARLAALISRYKAVVVAFSGGVDSTLLLAMARRHCGGRVVAVTAESPVHPLRERDAAAAITRMLGVEHIVFDSHEMDLPDFRANPRERCYICKKQVLAEIDAVADKLGIADVAHGVNRDDLGDYRPGLQAAREMGVHAPLLEAGLGKSDIRALSRQMNLPTWDKPSLACLASRIPYGRPITRPDLAMVEAAEDFLLASGLENCRVRHHGAVARLEVDPQEFDAIMATATRRRIVERLREIGFTHVALDLEGYTMGSLNREIRSKEKG